LLLLELEKPLDRPWTIGEKLVKEATFYTYLGIDFENDDGLTFLRQTLLEQETAQTAWQV
jgi:hypothetical protein